MSERLNKVNGLIRDEMSKILLEEMHFDNVFVTVLSANTSPTLEHSTVFVSVIPYNQKRNVLRQLKKDIYNLQQALNKHIIIRPVPKIRFEIDEGQEIASRIDEILKNS